MTIEDIHFVKRTTDGIELRGTDIRGLNLSFSPTLCAADQETSIRLTFDEYVAQVLNPMILRGEIDDTEDKSANRHDDRKLRYGHADIIGNNLEIGLGATNFLAFRFDLNLPPEKRTALQRKGLEKYQDNFAYFSQPLGVTVIMVSSDGSTFLGPRLNQEYSGSLNPVAGYVRFRRPEEVDLVEDCKREVTEEANIDPNDFAHDPQLVGIYFNPINGDVDLTYHLNVNLSDEKIIAAWSQNTSSEHGPLVKLATMNDVLRLLEEGKVPESYENQDRKFEIVYATRGGLENLTEEQIRR